MADGDVIQIDDALWRQKLAKYVANIGGGMIEALNEEWPQLMDLVVRLTPPNSLSQGRKAVARDIYRTMRPFDPKSTVSFKSLKQEGIGGYDALKKIARKRDIAAYNLVAARITSGPMAGTTAVHFSPEYHKQARNRYGRVGRDIKRVVLGSDVPILKRYVRQVQDRVGFAKAGWLAALRLVGGKIAPAWVERHGATGAGAVVDDRNNPDNPSITAINRTPWAVRKDEGRRIISDATSARAQAIDSKIATKLRLARQNAGFDRAA